MQITIEEPNSYAKAQGEVYYDGTVKVQSPAFANPESPAVARLKAQVDAKFTDSWVSLTANNATLAISVTSDKRYKLEDMLTEIEKLLNTEFSRLKRINSSRTKTGGAGMALTKIKKELNSSMTPQAMRVFNKCVQRVINAIDEAAEEMADYPEAAYQTFLDELEGTIQATLDRLREDV